MPEQDDAKRKGKPTVSNDNHDDNVAQRGGKPDGGERGEAVTSGGNKIHGDELEGIIPGRPSHPHTDREPK